MALPDFEVHLGGGVYIDSAGNMRVGAQPPNTVPVYSPPFQLPVDPGKLKESVSSVEKALKGFTDDPDVRKKFERFGYADKILDVLAGVAAVASIIAPVLSVLAFAVTVLKLFGLFKSGPTPFEASVTQSLNTLQASYRITFDAINKVQIDKSRSNLHDAWTAVDGYYSLLKHGNPTVEQVQQLFNDMNAKIQAIGGDLNFLSDQVIWNTVFDRNSYGLWGYHQKQMMTMPRSGTTDFVQAYFPPDEQPAFDHRMMLPIIVYAATTYLTCLRGANPEYRTVGQTAPKLRDLADKLDDLAELMRNFGMGRLIYSRDDFLAIPAGDVKYFKLGDKWMPLGVRPTCGTWPVGALDLRYHDDAFFSAFLNELTLAEVVNLPHETQKAGIEFRWIPPALLAPEQEMDGQPGFPPSTFKILNPDECAAAANAWSEQAYADLLATSGYVELVRIAALVRNESTEPLVSQTVALRDINTYRDPQPSQRVHISSGGSGWVEKTEGEAKRSLQNFAARITASTQPVKRPWPIQYKVYLRALDHGAAGRSWSDHEYTDFCSAYYSRKTRASTSGGQRIDNELTIQKLDGMCLDEHLIAQGVTSFDHPPAQGEIDLKVDTFDWWIPVRSIPSFPGHVADLAATMNGLNWFPVSGGGTRSSVDIDRFTADPPMILLDDSLQQVGRTVETGIGAADFQFLGWKSGAQTWTGEKREPKRLTAKIAYELTWQGDTFALQIRTRPEDRNFTLFLVFEELLPSTGKPPHTAIPISVNACLTYVPDEFFKREAEAIARGGKAIARFYKFRVVEGQEIGPFPDPAFRTISPTDLLSLEKVTVLSQHLQGLGVRFEDFATDRPG